MGNAHSTRSNLRDIAKVGTDTINLVDGTAAIATITEKTTGYPDSDSIRYYGKAENDAQALGVNGASAQRTTTKFIWKRSLKLRHALVKNPGVMITAVKKTMKVFTKIKSLLNSTAYFVSEFASQYEHDKSVTFTTNKNFNNYFEIRYITTHQNLSHNGVDWPNRRLNTDKDSYFLADWEEFTEDYNNGDKSLPASISKLSEIPKYLLGNREFRDEDDGYIYDRAGDIMGIPVYINTYQIRLSDITRTCGIIFAKSGMPDLNFLVPLRFLETIPPDSSQGYGTYAPRANLISYGYWSMMANSMYVDSHLLRIYGSVQNARNDYATAFTWGEYYDLGWRFGKNLPLDPSTHDTSGLIVTRLNTHKKNRRNQDIWEFDTTKPYQDNYETISVVNGKLQWAKMIVIGTPDQYRRDIIEMNINKHAESGGGGTIRGPIVKYFSIKGLDLSSRHYDNRTLDLSWRTAGRTFTNEIIDYCRFDDSWMMHTPFSNSEISNSIFVNTQLEGSHFENTRIINCFFNSTYLYDTQISMKTCYNVDITDIVVNKSFKLLYHMDKYARTVEGKRQLWYVKLDNENYKFDLNLDKLLEYAQNYAQANTIESPSDILDNLIIPSPESGIEITDSSNNKLNSDQTIFDINISSALIINLDNGVDISLGSIPNTTAITPHDKDAKIIISPIDNAKIIELFTGDIVGQDFTDPSQKGKQSEINFLNKSKIKHVDNYLELSIGNYYIAYGNFFTFDVPSIDSKYLTAGLYSQNLDTTNPQRIFLIGPYMDFSTSHFIGVSSPSGNLTKDDLYVDLSGKQINVDFYQTTFKYLNISNSSFAPNTITGPLNISTSLFQDNTVIKFDNSNIRLCGNALLSNNIIARNTEANGLFTKLGLPYKTTISGLNVSDSDLTYSKFNHIRFSEFIFNKTLLGKCEFTSCVFETCNFTDIIFDNTKFVDCVFIDCTLVNITFNLTTLSQCSFQNTILVNPIQLTPFIGTVNDSTRHSFSTLLKNTPIGYVSQNNYFILATAMNDNKLHTDTVVTADIFNSTNVIHIADDYNKSFDFSYLIVYNNTFIANTNTNLPICETNFQGAKLLNFEAVNINFQNSKFIDTAAMFTMFNPDFTKSDPRETLWPHTIKYYDSIGREVNCIYGTCRGMRSHLNDFDVTDGTTSVKFHNCTFENSTCTRISGFINITYDLDSTLDKYTFTDMSFNDLMVEIRGSSENTWYVRDRVKRAEKLPTVQFSDSGPYTSIPWYQVELLKDSLEYKKRYSTFVQIQSTKIKQTTPSTDGFWSYYTKFLKYSDISGAILGKNMTITDLHCRQKILDLDYIDDLPDYQKKSRKIKLFTIADIDLSGCTFINVTYRGSYINCTFNKCKFKNCTFISTFTNCEFNECNSDGYFHMGRIPWNSNSQKISPTSYKVLYTGIQFCNFTNNSFEDLRLYNCLIQSSIFTGTNVSNFANIQVKECLLYNSLFNNINMTGNIFEQCYVFYTTFNNCILRNGIFQNVCFSRVNCIQGNSNVDNLNLETFYNTGTLYCGKLNWNKAPHGEGQNINFGTSVPDTLCRVTYLGARCESWEFSVFPIPKSMPIRFADSNAFSSFTTNNDKRLIGPNISYSYDFSNSGLEHLNSAQEIFWRWALDSSTNGLYIGTRDPVRRPYYKNPKDIFFYKTYLTPDTLVSISNVDFSNRLLKYVNFSNSTLTNCDFSGSNMGNINFSSCQLSTCNLNNAVLNGANLTQIETDNTSLFNTELMDCIFNNSNLKSKMGELSKTSSSHKSLQLASNNIIFGSGITLANVTISNEDLSNMVIDNVTFENVTFSNCNFTNTIFKNVVQTNSSMNTCTIHNTTIHNINNIFSGLVGTRIGTDSGNIIVGDKFSLREADMNGITLIVSNLNGVYTTGFINSPDVSTDIKLLTTPPTLFAQGVRIDDIVFNEQIDLKNLNISNSKITHCIFNNKANVYDGLNITNVDFTGTHFEPDGDGDTTNDFIDVVTGTPSVAPKGYGNVVINGLTVTLGPSVELLNTSVTNVDMKGIDFTDANLKNCKFENVDMRGCNFENAILENCSIKNCVINGIKINENTILKGIQTHNLKIIHDTDYPFIRGQSENINLVVDKHINGGTVVRTATFERILKKNNTNSGYFVLNGRLIGPGLNIDNFLWYPFVVTNDSIQIFETFSSSDQNNKYFYGEASLSFSYTSHSYGIYNIYTKTSGDHVLNLTNCSLKHNIFSNLFAGYAQPSFNINFTGSDLSHAIISGVNLLTSNFTNCILYDIIAGDLKNMIDHPSVKLLTINSTSDLRANTHTLMSNCTLANISSDSVVGDISLPTNYTIINNMITGPNIKLNGLDLTTASVDKLNLLNNKISGVVILNSKYTQVKNSDNTISILGPGITISETTHKTVENYNIIKVL